MEIIKIVQAALGVKFDKLTPALALQLPFDQLVAQQRDHSLAQEDRLRVAGSCRTSRCMRPCNRRRLSAPPARSAHRAP